MIWLACLWTAAFAQNWSLHRLELISDDPGLWLNHELPGLVHRPGTAALRFVGQVQPTLNTPWSWKKGELRLGLSLACVSLSWERAVRDSLDVGVGVQTALGLPRGMMGGIAWRRGAIRIGGGLSVLSAASWSQPDYGTWETLPTLSVAWLRRKENP